MSVQGLVKERSAPVRTTVPATVDGIPSGGASLARKSGT